MSSTSVEQGGVRKWRNLLRQRTRWAWGNLQALRDYVLNLEVFRSRIMLRKKFGISIYFAFIAVSFLVLLFWI
ncbi:MAG: hypothetical protein OEZ48_09575 [Candidatus Bathyarchaeota archaeon]|nr:hypothetical protein [Candidatus Bathyarchaeota archaeon]